MLINHTSPGTGVIVWRQASEPFVPATMRPGKKYSVESSPKQAFANNNLNGTGLTSVEKDLTLAYNIVDIAIKDLSISYNIIGTSEKDLALAYTVISAVTKDQSLSYGIAGTVDKDLSLAYDILAAGVVTKDFALSYSVFNSAEKDLALSNYILDTAVSNLTLSYSLTGSVIKNLALSYIIDGGTFVLPDPIDDDRIYTVPVGNDDDPIFIKDPDEILDYGFDFADLLATIENDSVASFNIYAAHPVTIEAMGVDTNGIYGALVSGGYNRANAALTCRLLMQSGRRVESTILIQVRNK